MKKIVRIFLLVECVVFLTIFARDLELLSTPNSLFASMHTKEDWIWLFLAEGLPLVSMVVAAVYAFMKRFWKKRFLLAVAVALYAVFLLLSEPLRVNPNYVCVPPVLTLAAVGVYIACVFVEKIHHRQWVAFGAMMLLAGSLLVVYICGGLNPVLDWGPMYVLPMIPFAMLGRILPGQYD